MANEKRTVRYGIKGKLISAIAMLMVAVIMTVSSTYAWFTLSTAPEVTGISTAVGANGALEMVLLSKADGDWAYKTGADVYGDKNTTWGNLVDLSTNAIYGTNQIILYPSALNTTLSDKVNMDSPLFFPQYGPDGRVETVNGQTQVAGAYGTNGFVENDEYGFRAVGTTSGLSEREQALRAAVAAINIAKNQGKSKAEASLTANGATLANMAIQKVMRDDPTFTATEYNAVASMIAGLKETITILDEAYQQAILAWAASNATTEDDTVYTAVKGIVDDDVTFADVNAVIAEIQRLAAEWESTLGLGTGTLVLPDWIVGAALSQFSDMKTKVAEAEGALTTLGVKETYTYNEISGALQPLVNMSQLKVNDLELSDKDAIMASALANKAVWVSMATGSGVYADVADQCGSYVVSINVDAGALLGSSTPIEMGAEMRAVTTLGNTHLQNAVDEAQTAGAPANATGATPFSEFYGYIVDLGFRTNATGSNLLLQQEGIDRIYTDNNNESTMGHGSSMTFTSTSTGFTTDQVKALMRHIRIVFFETEGENTIYAYAKLDVDNATVSSGSVTATMYLYDAATGIKKDDGIITALTQNAVKHVSALVYLDGETIQNSDVAADAAASMTGTANFQFASDANLVPMEYGNLHTPNPTDPSNP